LHAFYITSTAYWRHYKTLLLQIRIAENSNLSTQHAITFWQRILEPPEFKQHRME